MIVGLGIDVCSISRVRKNLERFGLRFMEKVLDVEERKYCEGKRDSAPSFAGRFAAKEAAIKALGAPEGLRWYDMEVIAAAGGPPTMRFHRVAEARASQLGVTHVHLTITHDGDVAAAVVVLEAR